MAPYMAPYRILSRQVPVLAAHLHEVRALLRPNDHRKVLGRLPESSRKVPGRFALSSDRMITGPRHVRQTCTRVQNLHTCSKLAHVRPHVRPHVHTCLQLARDGGCHVAGKFEFANPTRQHAPQDQNVGLSDLLTGGVSAMGAPGRCRCSADAPVLVRV